MALAKKLFPYRKATQWNLTVSNKERVEINGRQNKRGYKLNKGQALWMPASCKPTACAAQHGKRAPHVESPPPASRDALQVRKNLLALTVEQRPQLNLDLLLLDFLSRRDHLFLPLLVELGPCAHRTAEERLTIELRRCRRWLRHCST